MDEGRGIRVDSGVCRHFGGRRDGVRALFFSTWGQGEHRDKDSISSKWTDINNKCHAFQEVFQRNYDNRPSGEGPKALSRTTSVGSYFEKVQSGR
ncbi:hypothetical protein Hanom_Chr03g00264611 [Helianthus anomalus]